MADNWDLPAGAILMKRVTKLNREETKPPIHARLLWVSSAAS